MKIAEQIIRFAFAALLMTMLPVALSAATWDYVARGNNCDISVDRNSVTQKGALFQCWVLFDYQTVKKFPDGREFSSSEFLYEIDSSKRMITILSSYAFAENGGSGAIMCSGYDDSRPPISITSDSVAESILDYLSRATPKTGSKKPQR